MMIFVVIILQLLINLIAIKHGYAGKIVFSMKQINKDNEEIFICNGRHYHDYSSALKCFKKQNNTSFFYANRFVDGKKTVIFYAKGNTFNWELLWKSTSWNNNQWAINNIHRSVQTESTLNKPIIDPIEKPKEDLMRPDKYNISIHNLREIFLQETNEYRAIHNVPNITTNCIIEKRAQLWAEKLARTNICKTIHGMCHERDTTYGENIAMGTFKYAKFAVKMWYREIKDFDFDSYKLKASTLHFSQLIWKGTKQMGCGVARSKKMRYFIVCKYYPPGNVKEMTKWNVPRPRE